MFFFFKKKGGLQADCQNRQNNNSVTLSKIKGDTFLGWKIWHVNVLQAIAYDNWKFVELTFIVLCFFAGFYETKQVVTISNSWEMSFQLLIIEIKARLSGSAMFKVQHTVCFKYRKLSRIF